MEGMFRLSSSLKTDVPPPVTLPAPFMESIPLSGTSDVGMILQNPSPMAYVIAIILTDFKSTRFSNSFLAETIPFLQSCLESLNMSTTLPSSDMMQKDIPVVP